MRKRHCHSERSEESGSSWNKIFRCAQDDRIGRSILLLFTLILSSCASSQTMAPVYKYGVESGVGSLGAHTVQSGDSVWTVAQKYNVDLRGIIEVNHLSPPYALKAGSRLKLPAPRTYTVHGRDNLYTISRLFNSTQTELASLNKLSPPYKLKNGQVLKLPSIYETAAVEAAPASSAPVIPMGAGAMPAKVEAVPLASPAPVATSYPPQPAPATPAAVTPQPAPITPAVAQNLDPVPSRAGKFLKPVAGNIISTFGSKEDGQHNDGINIQAIKGDPVRAAENGKVVYVGHEIEGYGTLILLRHQDQYMTAYAHLDKALVKKGETIMRGQTIGTVGSTGFVDKPQLHFEIRKGKTAVDPAGLI